MSTFEIIYSEKGKTLIVLNNFKYRFHKLLAGGVKRWVCSLAASKKCTAFIKTTSDNRIAECADKHNHQQLSDASINRQKFNNDLKRKATEDICERVLKIIQRELLKADINTLTINDVRCVRKNKRS